MRVVFMGTPEFAVPSLRALLARHEVALVVSQPDRPAGRGMALRRSPVAALADAAGVPVLTPARVREPEAQARVRGAGAEALVVAAYGQILPTTLLDAAPLGGINVHASLLPRWRGASPIAAAILAGDRRTGVSIMRMEAGLDTGPVLLRREVEIAPSDTTGSLTARLAEVGAAALLDGLDRLAAGLGAFIPQPGAGVTHAGLVRKADGDWEWDRPAAELERAMRAYDPWPGLRLPLGSERVRVVAGRPLPAWSVEVEGRAPGDVLEVGREGIAVMALDQPFLLTELRPPGRRGMAAADYARGRRDLVVREG
ncbi:MAG TPA: methionyl-tRNA formyltransferase [Candidatus Dormibacteraeota bacterium]|jgi:methionyl-tRNA formyltransferase|nr:methionyl-tRNA formyltransferase [Candidatus Dormibacteraeota bacterium]